MAEVLVSKESLLKLLNCSRTQHGTIANALVVLFDNQVEDEKKHNVTNHHNMKGFRGSDARQGCICAKTFLKHGSLAEFQIDMWLKPNAKGEPRILKYHRQLNEAALARKAQC